jgi:hypothetical protein
VHAQSEPASNRVGIKKYFILENVFVFTVKITRVLGVANTVKDKGIGNNIMDGAVRHPTNQLKHVLPIYSLQSKGETPSKPIASSERSDGIENGS